MTTLNKDNRAEFNGQIIDIFEDALTEKNITLSETDTPSDGAIIYGEHYDTISKHIDFILDQKNGIHTTPDAVSTTDLRSILNMFLRVCGNALNNFMLFHETELATLMFKLTDTFSKWGFSLKDEPQTIDDIKIDNNFSVDILSPDGSRRTVYEFIKTIKEAYILAQYAMDHDRDSDMELVVIFPGFNIGICKDDSTRKIAAKLAEKYRSDDED